MDVDGMKRSVRENKENDRQGASRDINAKIYNAKQIIRS